MQGELKISRIDVIGQNGNDGAAYDGLCGECWIETGSTDCVCKSKVDGAGAGLLPVHDGGREDDARPGAGDCQADLAAGVGGVGQIVYLIIEGEPVGKGRPKAVRQGGFVRMYTPAKTRGYEEQVADEARKAMAGREPIAGPCMLELTMVVGIPVSWSKKKRASALAGEMFPTKKPDADNVIKALCDSLNGIVWVDDVQVTDLIARKRFGANPHVEARITPLDVAGSS